MNFVEIEDLSAKYNYKNFIRKQYINMFMIFEWGKFF